VGIGSPVTTPYAYYSNSSGAGRSIALGDMDQDMDLDVVLGTRTGTNVGVIEVWLNNGWATYTRTRQLTAAGEVNALATGDFNSDGLIDIAAGTKIHSNDKTGQIEVWVNGPSVSFQRHGPWDASGKVNALAAGMMDDDSTLDLVAGTKTGNNSGRVDLWLGDDTGDLSPGDHVIADEVVLSIAVGPIDLGTGLDIAAGTAARSVQAWFCVPEADEPDQIMPTIDSWGDANTGGIVNALAIRKLEAPADRSYLDPLSDIVCGTAISATSGEIVIYLNPFVWTYNP